MMRSLGIDIQIEMPKDAVLNILRRNREQHAQIIEEAKQGYIVAMREALTKMAKEWEEASADKPFPSVKYLSQPPSGHLHVFDSAIRMIEHHLSTTVTLSADAHRNLVENEWEWTDQFIGQARLYSNTAALGE